MTTNNTTITTAALPPAGTTTGDDWQHGSGHDYRIIYGANRSVGGCPDISVQPTCIQLDDGGIDDGSAVEAPCIHVDGVGGVPLTIAQARQLGAEILAAADELAALAPAEPLDRFSTAEILNAIASRMG